MVQIIPAILATTEEEYKDKLFKIESSGVFEEGWVQIDLMDNKFVQNKSIGADVIAKYPISLKQEAHLMVEYPENWIDELVKTNVNRIIFPLEDIQGIEEKIQHIKNHQIQVGLSINPETPIDYLKKYIDDINCALVMSVHPGFGGQEFMPEILSKVNKIKELSERLTVGVDGGISIENAKLVVDSGADYLVIGSHLLEGNIEENLERIWEVING